ncbi:unnamed protein product [Heligmosomoides polygyrus]|uniref:Ammonium_transp domain-containing protein n=1 Tax=Heligmosomoides polygyrus TaxID=6339 RepID=A0A3P8BTZ7_HELPZ|nr:unnamed protein product [Heligmosomoides polygyrus]
MELRQVRPMLYFGDASPTLRHVTNVGDSNVAGDVARAVSEVVDRFCGDVGDVYLEYAKNSLMFGLVFNAVLLASSGWHIGTTLVPGNRIGNCLYQLDALASICIGIAWLTFPKWLLHKQVVVPLDESHELCGRVMGALFVTSYAVSAHALHWTDNSQKMMAVDSRVVGPQSEIFTAAQDPIAVDSVAQW